MIPQRLKETTYSEFTQLWRHLKVWSHKGQVGSFAIFSIQNLLLKYRLRRHLHNQAINWLLPLWWWNDSWHYEVCPTSSLLPKVLILIQFFLIPSGEFYKKCHQSQQLALQSSFPESMIVLSVMTTSVSATKWRTKSRRISWYHSTWICPPILFLLSQVLCFTPMFYITFLFPDVLLSS